MFKCKLCEMEIKSTSVSIDPKYGRICHNCKAKIPLVRTILSMEPPEHLNGYARRIINARGGSFENSAKPKQRLRAGFHRSR